MFEVTGFGDAVVVCAVGQRAPDLAVGVADSEELGHVGWSKDGSEQTTSQTLWLGRYLRHDFVFQATKEQNWDLGDLGQDVLACPVLVAEPGEISGRREDTVMC